MTYTNDERVAIEGIKYDVKVSSMIAINDAKIVYEDSIITERDIYNAKVRTIKEEAKETLKTLKNLIVFTVTEIGLQDDNNESENNIYGGDSNE